MLRAGDISRAAERPTRGWTFSPSSNAAHRLHLGVVAWVMLLRSAPKRAMSRAGKTPPQARYFCGGAVPPWQRLRGTCAHDRPRWSFSPRRECAPLRMDPGSGRFGWCAQPLLGASSGTAPGGHQLSRNLGYLSVRAGLPTAGPRTPRPGDQGLAMMMPSGAGALACHVLSDLGWCAATRCHVRSATAASIRRSRSSYWATACIRTRMRSCSRRISSTSRRASASSAGSVMKCSWRSRSSNSPRKLLGVDRPGSSGCGVRAPGALTRAPPRGLACPAS